MKVLARVRPAEGRVMRMAWTEGSRASIDAAAAAARFAPGSAPALDGGAGEDEDLDWLRKALRQEDFQRYF